MSTIYNRDYFIKKFEAIPHTEWCRGTFISSTGQCCALGHCGERSAEPTTKEGNALLDLFHKNGRLPLVGINDGRDSRFPQHGPKARILAALRSFPQ